MTLLYTQGFEGYNLAATQTALEKDFNYQRLVPASKVTLVAGRNGNGLAASHDGSPVGGAQNGLWGHLLPVSGLSSQDDWIVGFAFYNDYPWWEAPGSNARSPLLQFADSDGDVMLSIYPAAGTLNVRSGGTSGGTKLGFADALMTTKVWHYLECKVNFNSTTGSVVLRLNEEEVLSLSNVNTATTTSGDLRPSMIAFGGGLRYNDFWVDDIYICDDQGSVNNDFLGDIRIERLSPDGNGNSSDFLGSDADSTDNYLLVDDVSAGYVVTDNDTTYVSSSTVGEKDTYTFANSSESPASIAAVSIKTWMRKSDAGSRNFVHVARSVTTEDSSAVLYPSVDYRYMESIFPNDPATSAPWLIAGVNAAEFGYEVNA